MGDGEGECLRQRGDLTEESLLALRLLEDVLLSRRQERQPLSRCTRGPLRPVEPMEERRDNLVLLQHERDGLLLVDGRPPLAVTLRVVLQRLLQLVCEAEVVHDESAGFVVEDPVHTRDGLHQPMAAHGLVHIHRVQARGVEAGQPHVPDDHDLERVLLVLEALRQPLPTWLVTDVLLPRHRV